jgi:hypothetical protein
MLHLYWLLAFAILLRNSCVLDAVSASESSTPRIRNRNQPAAEVIDQRGLKAAVTEAVASQDAAKVPTIKRVLVVYHVGLISLDYSSDVVVNNLKIFSSAVLSHHDGTHAEALYLFNILGGDTNPFFKYLPCSNVNTMCASSDHEAAELETLIDLETHRDVVDILGEDLLTQFKHVMFMNHEARGPFEKHTNGEWLTMFTSLMDKPNRGVANTALLSSYGHHMVPVAAAYEANSTQSIGAVSVGISCEPEPRLLTHAFMLSSARVTAAFGAVSTAASATEESQSGSNREEHLGAALTMHLLRKGVTIASLVQMARFSPSSVRPDLAAQVATEFEQANPAGEYIPHVLGDSSAPAPAPPAVSGQTGTVSSGPGDRDGEEPPEPVAEDTIHEHAITHLKRPLPDDNRRGLSAHAHSATVSTTAAKTSGTTAHTRTTVVKRPTTTHSRSAAAVPPLVDHVDSAIYKNKCLASSSNVRTTSNPTMWCNLLPSEILFVRYGGAVLRTPGILCEDTAKAITDATIALAAKVPQLRLRLPENPYGGIYRDLYAQYSSELWQWQNSEKYHSAVRKMSDAKHGKAQSHSHHHRSTLSSKSSTAVAASGGQHGKPEPCVCFLIRSAHVHSLKQAPGQPPTRLVKMDLKLLIQSEYQLSCWVLWRKHPADCCGLWSLVQLLPCSLRRNMFIVVR